MNPIQLREYIIKPVLNGLDMYSDAAEELLFGTAAVESDLQYVRQFNDGPARGLWQMEPATHDDIVKNWHSFKKYKDLVLLISGASEISSTNLEHNLKYAAAFTRLHYWRKPTTLPDSKDVIGLAHYWKEHYNTKYGKGTVEHFEKAYRKYTR